MFHTDYPYASGSDDIHEGFYGSYNTLGSNGITSALLNLFETYPGSDILVTGHRYLCSVFSVHNLSLK